MVHVKQIACRLDYALVCYSLFVVSVNVAISDCGTKVRAMSPCETQADLCIDMDPSNAVVCPTTAETISPGDFQCDAPNTGTTCQGSGAPFAPCKVNSACVATGNTCQIAAPYNPVGAETKVTVPCAE